jgi:hypothetical protein
MRKILLSIIVLFIHSTLWAQHCFEEFLSTFTSYSWKRAKISLKDRCDDELSTQFIEKVEQAIALNPSKASMTREFFENQVYRSAKKGHQECRRQINLGQCIEKYLEDDIGYELNKNWTVKNSENADKTDYALGRVLSPSGSCTYTAISNQHIMTALHCFLPTPLILSTHFGESFRDIVKKQNEWLEVVQFSGESHRLGIDDILVFSGIDQYRPIEDDIIVIKLSKPVFGSYLETGVAFSDDTGVLAGYPLEGGINISADLIQVIGDFKIGEDKIVFGGGTKKGHSGSSLRIQASDGNHSIVVGVLFGKEFGETIVSAITQQRHREILDFLNTGLNNQKVDIKLPL